MEELGENAEIVRKVGEVRIHPDYVVNSTDHADIALVRLAKKAVFRPGHVSKICLPGADFNDTGISGKVAGWAYSLRSTGNRCIRPVTREAMDQPLTPLAKTAPSSEVIFPMTFAPQHWLHHPSLMLVKKYGRPESFPTEKNLP